MDSNMNPWSCCKWKQDLDFHPQRSGLRIRVDSEVPNVIRKHCLHFAAWLRKKYEFPIRVPVYIKAKTLIKASDGELVSALFFEPSSRTVEPYARIAAGTMDDFADEYAIKNSICEILCSIAHELTHYFQWINHMEACTNPKIEWQAVYYGHKFSEMYAMEYIWTPVERAILEMKSNDVLTTEDYQMMQRWGYTENSSVKEMIIALLAQCEGEKAMECLLQLSNDSNAKVRAYALDVLCGFPNPKCTRRLQQAVRDEKDTYARYCAIRSCADLMIYEAEDIHTIQPFFQDVLGKETAPLCRLACDYALYKCGVESALTAILKMLDIKSEDLQCEVVIVLQDIVEPKNVQSIIKAVKRLQKKASSESLGECIQSFYEVAKTILEETG